jgi:hypothetical protein
VTAIPPGRGRAVLAVLLAAGAVLISSCSRGSAPPEVGVVAPLPQPTELPATPTPAPTPAPTPPPPPPVSYAPVHYAPPRPAPPAYPLIGEFDAPTVGIHLPVVAVGIVHGAMDAPEGPIGSMFWREAFWLRLGVIPGNPGTATIAGHLDDFDARPAAFWNIRNVHVGDEVVVTRTGDGAVERFRIVETDVWTLAQANTPASRARIYGDGTAGDRTSRLTMITCTGRWVNGEYDHRFVAFAVLET